MAERMIEVEDRLGGKHTVPYGLRHHDVLDGHCHITGEKCEGHNCDDCPVGRKNENALDKLMKLCQ